MGESNRVHGQRKLLARIEQLIRLIRRDLCYRGSKDTADLGGAVHERLLRSPSLADKFNNQPEELRGLLRTVVRHVLIDEIRHSAAQKNQRPEDKRFVLEWKAHFVAGVEPGEPQHVLTERQRDVQRVLEELELFRLGADDQHISPERRERMVRALTMSWEGYSHSEIAAAFHMPKSTVGHDINTLVGLLATRVVQAGGMDLDADDDVGTCREPLMAAAR